MIPVNYVEIIEILDEKMKAAEAQRQAAIAEAQDVERRASEAAEAERQALEAGRVSSLSDDALLAECAHLARERKQILVALLSEKDRRLGAVATQPPIWQIIEQYSLAMAQVGNHTLPRPAMRANENLAMQCRKMIMLEVMRENDGSQPTAIDPIIPEVKQKTLSFMASKVAFTFYAVNPFKAGSFPADAKLMVVGHHEHLGYGKHASPPHIGHLTASAFSSLS